MAKKMSDQIQFGQWESLPRGSKERQQMEKDYIAQHHVGGGSISDLMGSLGHTLSHPFATTHGVPTGYGFLASLIPGLGEAGAAAGAAGEAGAGAAEAAGAAEGAGAAEEGAAARTGLKRLVPKTAKGKAALLGAGGLGALAYSKSGGAAATPQVNPGQAAVGQNTGQAAGGANLQGAAMMPLFMQQIMEPYLNSIMQQIHGTSQQYGNYMQGMISGKGPTGVALNPAIAQALQAMVPGQQAAMNLLGQSGAGSVVAGGALDQLSAQIQKGIQTQQAAQGAYEKNLLMNEYGSGGIPGITGTGVPSLSTAPGLTNPATNPLAKQIASGGGTITG